MTEFQWDLEAAWGKKCGESEDETGVTPGDQCLPGIPSAKPVGFVGPWFAKTLLVSPSGGTPKQQKFPWVTGTGCQVFRKTLSKPVKESNEAKKAGVLPWRPMPSQKPPLLALGAHRVPGLHPGCVSVSWGEPQSSKQALVDGDWMGDFNDMLRQPMENNHEADEVAGVIPPWPVPFPQPLHQTWWARGVPGLH